MAPEATSEADVNGDPHVPVGEFFAERSVFVTGATGFLGKVLVEKLLRGCPGVKAIYLLMRPKRGRSLDERLADIVDSPLFDLVKKEQPSTLNKMIPIQGDISEPDLGISLADQETLTQNVSVVFHSAATVRFNEPLKVAVQINLLGTKKVMDLCRRMTGLKALVHVSTTYSNCDLEEVDEVIYPPPYDPEGITQCIQWMDDDTMEKVTPILVGKRPNTYTFSKALTESMIEKEGAGLPIAIVRPSVVTATWKDPMPGWVEGMNGLNILIVPYCQGLLRTFHCNGQVVVDIIPVDVVVNLMIAVAWKRSKESKAQLAVYNCCSGIQSPLTFDEVLPILYTIVQSHPLEKVVWYPSSDILCKSRPIHQVRDLLQHIIPAYLMDFTRKLLMKKPMLVRVDQKIRSGMQATLWGRIHSWRFIDNNTLNLNTYLSERDQQVFYFDIRGIHWPSYMETYVIGVRTHIRKEHPDTIPRSRTLLNRLLWIQRASKLFGLVLFIYAVMYVFF